MSLTERHKAIRRLHEGGFGLYEISNACQLSVEQVRAVLDKGSPTMASAENEHAQG